MALTINVDMDGVVYDFMGQMKSYAEQTLDRNLPEVTSWSAWDEWGIPSSEFWQMFHRAIEDGELFSGGLEIQGAVGAINQLHRDGHRIRIVTSKRLRTDESSLKAQKQTLTWLYTHGLLGLVEVAFATNKQGYLADVVIDDKPTLAWVQRDAFNILFDTTWNQYIQTPMYDPKLIRARSWTVVMAQITMLDISTTVRV